MRGAPRFTLVHLLVLVALITLGIAYLVPVIQRSREQANLTRCKDNLRRIGVGLLQYARANDGALPVSQTVANPHKELVDSLMAGGDVKNPADFYCPSQRQPALQYSSANFKSGILGYYYYCALEASSDRALSKFLRSGLAWPRKLNTSMAPKSWVMSDIWISGQPTAHVGYRKGLNYLMLDGSVAFVSESPRQSFH